MPSKIIAPVIALSGFAVALVAGMAAGNTAATTLSRALLAMVVCYLVGLALAAVGRRAIREHVDHYKSQNPIDPDQSTDEPAAQSHDPAAEPGINPEPAAPEIPTPEQTPAPTGPAAGAAA